MTKTFWLNRKEAAELISVSLPTFDLIRAQLPPEATQPGTGREKLFDGRQVVKAYVEREVVTKSDPLMGSGDSPALERYREHRAGIAGLELEKLKGSHIDVRLLESALNRFIDRLRSGGELLQRKFGNEASEVFNSAIAAAAEHVQSDLEASSGNGAN